MKGIGGDHSFLTRLRRDTRGNTIALVAAALIPLAGMIGGAVDMSRLYLTKTRLQQACDAGALAGRKVMATGAWTTGDNSAESKAKEMFNANFAEGAYGTDALLKKFSEDDGTVSGTASVVVPMTLIRIFGMTQRNLDVSCTAKMEIPNTDVMFVLDATGSMAGTRIKGLKSAVKCFYEALLRINTREVCGNDPSSTNYVGTAQIRIGFVPYSVNVNVGKLLPNEYLADKWTYQSREAVLNPTARVISVSEKNKDRNWSSYSTYKEYSDKTYTTSSCKDMIPSTTTAPAGSEGAAQGQSYNLNGTAVAWTTNTPYAEYQYRSSLSGKKCVIERQQKTYTAVSYYSRLKNYIYKPVEIDVRGLKAGGDKWNNSINLNLGADGAAATIGWDGCIEERQTVKTSSKNPIGEWTPIPAAAHDLDIDMIPNAATPGSQWGPLLAGAVWGRYTGTNKNNRTVSDVTTASDLDHNTTDPYCSSSNEAKKLQTWYTPGGFESYVDSLKAAGNTYHDIGMIWGARFISPTGIFASENAQTPTGGAIQRHIIFMTDGDTQTSITNLTAYGIPWWDRRQTTYEPMEPRNGERDLDNILNVRLAALCTAIKNRNIALWVVSYGGDTSANTEHRLRTCATPGKYFSAADTPTLIGNFKQIAAEIAELRLIN